VGVQTGVVVREAYTLFNEQTLRTGKCIAVLTKILYLINKGETFSDEEATQLFFSATKLFQSPHVNFSSFSFLFLLLSSLLFLSNNTIKLGPPTTHSLHRDQRAAHRL